MLGDISRSIETELSEELDAGPIFLYYSSFISIYSGILLGTYQ